MPAAEAKAKARKRAWKVTTNDRTWEHTLLVMAQQGLEYESLPEPLDGYDGLDTAYAACDEIANQNSHTFYLASRPLPQPKRKAVRSLYAFCRVTDDLIDRSQGDLAAGLAAWRACAMAWPPPCEDPVAIAWGDTRARYRIPTRYAEQLVQGVAADLQKKRYANFEELALYCYGVASTVGLMSMHIIGCSDDCAARSAAIPYAVKLGVAMQMTNILRDVKEDWDAGRVYLPQDELAEFGLSDADIEAGRATERWRDFMRFQVARNKQLYAEAMPGISLLHPTGRFAIGAAAELYRAILLDIERHDYDVFSRRAHVGTAGKLARIPGIWFRSIRGSFGSYQGTMADVAGAPVSAA
jgi:15-cis-phytoene synthase